MLCLISFTTFSMTTMVSSSKNEPWIMWIKWSTLTNLPQVSHELKRKWGGEFARVNLFLSTKWCTIMGWFNEEQQSTEMNIIVAHNVSSLALFHAMVCGPWIMSYSSSVILECVWTLTIQIFKFTSEPNRLAVVCWVLESLVLDPKSNV